MPKKKLKYKDVKTNIEKVEGYKLISKEYINNHTKLELECPSGHIFWIRFNNWQQGKRCLKCLYNSRKLKYKDVKAEIEKVEGYKLISKEYVNNHTKLEIKCPEGHKFLMNWNNFHTGNRCAECSGKKKKTIEFVKGDIEKEKGYKLISKEYVNSHTKLDMQCPKGHTFEMTWYHYKYRDQRCPQCYLLNKFSKGEKELLKYIQSITNTTIIENDRTQIINPKTGKYLELDIFLPELMKAIEYNGRYWHSSDYVKYKDNQKVIQCEKLGIDLLVVHENEWINNNEGVSNRNLEEFINGLF